MRKQLVWFILLLQACTGAEPKDIIGLWGVDQLVVDGLDRTERLPSLPWGTAIRFNADGTFQTNSRNNKDGKWKISDSGSSIFLYFNQGDIQYHQWKLLVSQQYLVLKATTQQLYLSHTDVFSVLPPPIIQENNLLGTWYFYQMQSDSNLMQYPQKKRHARWMKINKNGLYQSGEGDNITFRGYWLLHQDTLTFNDLDRPWRKQWKVRMDEEGVLYFHALTDDTAAWEVVSFVNEANLP